MVEGHDGTKLCGGGRSGQLMALQKIIETLEVIYRGATPHGAKSALGN